MRNVIVTGGSRGIGLAIVHRLAASDYRVIAVARNETDQVRELRRTFADRVAFRAADLRETDALPALAHDLRKTFGPIHGLVNNAGIGTGGLLATMPNREIEALIALNVLSPITFTKYVVRTMMADGGGRIVNMSSIIASTGYNALSVYAGTKAAMVGFTRSLAREVGSLNITVNAIAPGFVDTEMTRGLGEAGRDKIARRSALKRLPEAGDVAGAVDFLMGDAGRNITGTVLTIDAGNTA